MAERIIYDCDNAMGLLLREMDDSLTLLYLLSLWPGYAPFVRHC